MREEKRGTQLGFWTLWKVGLITTDRCFDEDHMALLPVGEIKEDKGDLDVENIILAAGDDEITLDDFVDISNHDTICSLCDVKVLGESPLGCFPVLDMNKSYASSCTFDGELGEVVLVFELE